MYFYYLTYSFKFIIILFQRGDTMNIFEREKKQEEVYNQVKELRSIRFLLEKNKEHFAIVELEKLIEKYPKNHIIMLEYGKLLTKTSRNLEAISILTNLEEFYLNKISDKEKFTLYYRLLLAYFYNHDYEKVLYYYKKTLQYIKYAEIDPKDIRIFLLCALKNLNKLNLDNIDKNKLKYSEMQAIFYSKTKAISHIKHHLKSFDQNQDRAIFDDDINIESLYLIAAERVKKSEKVCQSYATDIYHFEYENIGISDGEKTDVLQVVCINGTNNIISMYPVQKVFQNIEPLIYSYKPNSNKISKIKKFNKKYNLK